MNRRAFLASSIAILAAALVRPTFRTQGPCVWIARSCKGER
jgi:hypothetical protein